MAITNAWEFLIARPSQILGGLSGIGTGTYICLYEVPDYYNDAMVDDFRFKSVYCNDESDSYAVWQIGYELISLLNGAYTLYYHNFQKIRIEQLWKESQRVDFCENQGFAGLLGRPLISDQEYDRELEIARVIPQIYLVNRATEIDGVYLLLKYFDMEANWSNYFSILETVESLAKLDGIELNTSSTKRTAFTKTANNFSLAGFDSRHGFKEKIRKVGKRPPMTFDEAKVFIRDVVFTYLNNRI